MHEYDDIRYRVTRRVIALRKYDMLSVVKLSTLGNLKVDRLLYMTNKTKCIQEWNDFCCRYTEILHTYYFFSIAFDPSDPVA